MAHLVMPFDLKALPEGGLEALYDSGLYRLLPDDLQAACHRNPQLLEYLSMIPIEQTGVP